MSSVQSAVSAAERATLAQTFSDFALGLRLEDVPVEVRTRATHLMLDALGIAFASSQFEFAERAQAGVEAMAGTAGGTGCTTVIGQAQTLPPRDAALLNGILIHGLDYDDTHVPGVIHATASVLPTVLALGEQLDCTGAQMLTAYVAGAELGARIAAVPQGGFHKLGFHPTGLVGAFGSTLAASRLLGLDRAQTTMAQGIVLSMAAGSMEFLDEGAWTKRMHPGWAANAAISAAHLAKHGFVGPTTAYEGRFGLFATHVAADATCDFELATNRLGQDWEITRIAVKPFPACHFVHGCADAALTLRETHDIRPEAIRSVTAIVPEQVIPTVCEPAANKLRPISDYDAKFSLQYTIGASLVRGQFSLAELEADVLGDPTVLDITSKVRYEADPDSPFPRAYSGEVVVTLNDGRELRHREHINRGADERPLSNGEVAAKFFDNAHLAIPEAQARAVFDAIQHIETAHSITSLTETLRRV
ncbi:MAG: MmgE/PrpD family protein [Pseudomonadota bacterium]